MSKPESNQSEIVRAPRIVIHFSFFIFYWFRYYTHAPYHTNQNREMSRPKSQLRNQPMGIRILFTMDTDLVQ